MPQPIHLAASTKGRDKRTTISTWALGCRQAVGGQGALQGQAGSGLAGDAPERRLGLSGPAQIVVAAGQVHSGGDSRIHVHP